MNKQMQTNKKQNQQTKKQTKFQVQEQQNFSLSLNSGVTPPASHPGVGI
jgi:hypothetical protein